MKTVLVWHENFYPKLGGGCSYIFNLVSSISDYKYIILTNYIKGYPQKEVFSENAIIYRFPKKFMLNTKLSQKRFISFPFRVINNFLCLYSKYKFLLREFDLFHLHGVVFYNALLRLNKVFKKEIYQKVVNFSFVKQPKLLTLHNFFPDFTDDRTVIDAYNHYIDQFDNIICVDKHIYEYCISYSKQKGYIKKIWFIPNSIDTVDFNYLPLQSTGKLKIGFAGRLADTVDLDMLNQALEKLPDNMEFYFAISGHEKLLKIPKSAEGRVKVYINQPQKEMPNFYHNIDILFNPVLHKGITRVTLEAMACGRPVIMYKICDRDPIIDNVSGFLVQKNLEEIIYLLNFINRNPKLLDNIGYEARHKIEENYSNNVLFPQIANIYECLISSK